MCGSQSPQPPTRDEESIKRARREERERINSERGRGSTLLSKRGKKQKTAGKLLRHD